METSALATTQGDAHALVTRTPNARDHYPAAVYLASLAAGSRRTLREALNAMAALLTDHQADALTSDWAALRFQHTAANKM